MYTHKKQQFHTNYQIKLFNPVLLSTIYTQTITNRLIYRCLQIIAQYGHVTYYMSTFKFYHTVSDQVLAVFHPISALCL